MPSKYGAGNNFALEILSDVKILKYEKICPSVNLILTDVFTQNLFLLMKTYFATNKLNV